MKRFGVALLSAFVWLSLSAAAAYAGQQSGTSDQQSTSAQPAGSQSTTESTMSSEGKPGKLHHLKGKISDDGKSFTSDKDQKSWNITNPEAVKGHEGHDVTVSAHVYPDKGEIHVMSVKMGGKKASKEKGAAMSEQPPQ
ncbi:MAG: hypothetical protein JO249_26435 [Acidobacteria bacterium]|nr:hypothetical protein [Acidobacteriota bacterium]